MARRIIWSTKASNVFIKIIEFYFDRNGSKLYSKKLNSEIKKATYLLADNPFIGRKTIKANVKY